MATLSYFLANATTDSWRSLETSAQAATTINDGWVVSTGNTNHSEYAVGVERAASTFTGTTVPDGTLDTSLKDAFRSVAALTGDFASANWVFHFVVRGVTSAGSQAGRIRFRIITADADGSNATEITSGQQQASAVTITGTGTDFDSTLTVNPGAFSISGQYLFIQIAWERTAAGGMTNADVNWRTGSSSSAGTRITTSDFTLKVLGATIASGSTLNAAHSVALNVSGATIASGSQLLSGSVALVVTAESVAALTDNFDRADSTTLGTASGGFSWTETNGGNLSISSTTLTGAVGGLNLARAEQDLASADHFAQAFIGQCGDGCGLIVRYDASANNGYLCEVAGSECRIFRMDAGSLTQIGSSGAGVGTNFTAKLEAHGNTITLYIDGAVNTSASDSNYPTNVRTGVYSNLNGVLDNFQAGNLNSGAFITSGATLFAGTVSTGDAGITGAFISSGSTLNAGSVTLVVSGANISSTQVFAGTVALVVSGATIASGSQLFAGSATLVIAGATISGTEVFAGTVALNVSGATLASTTTLFAGTVVLEVNGATVASTLQLFAGTAVGDGTIAGAHIASTATLFSASATLTVDGASVAATTALFAGAVAIGVSGASIASTATTFAGTATLVINGATVTTTTALFAGTVSLTVTGATIANTATTFAGTVSMTVEGASISSTTTLFAGTLTTSDTLAGASISSTAQLFAGSVTLNVTGASIGATAVLFPGQVPLEGASISTTAQLFTGTVHLQASGASIGSTAVTFAGTISLTVNGATIASGSHVFAGFIGAPLLGSPIVFVVLAEDRTFVVPEDPLYTVVDEDRTFAVEADD